MSHEWMQRTALITVKAYPSISETYGETVCVAAVTKEEGWIRLYPLQFRTMQPDKQFAKYQLVQLRMKKHHTDHRPESFRPDEDSIRLLEQLSTRSDKNWLRRREWIDPNVSPSMCYLLKEQKETGTSLGAFRPRMVEDMIIKNDDPEWTGKKKGIMRGMSLFYKTAFALEKIPFSFKYRYKCEEEGCKGHFQTIIDWEVMELFRNLRPENDAREIKQKIREKYFDEMCGPKKEVCLFVGNHSQYLQSFMILGVFWPPKRERMLFS